MIVSNDDYRSVTEKILAGLVLSVAMCANIWATVLIGAIVHRAVVCPEATAIEFSFFTGGITLVSMVIWCAVVKGLDVLTVNYAITTVRHCNSIRRIGHILFILSLCWPRAIEMLYLGYKHRRLRAIAIVFDKSEIFNIALLSIRYEQYATLGIDEDDLKEYMVVHNNEYFFRNDEALSYMLIKYSTVTILKSFGFFDGLEPDKTPMMTIYGYVHCELRTKAAKELGEPYAKQTPDVVCKYIYFV